MDGFVFDGAAACKKALLILSQEPHFYWPQRCSVHGANLASADISKLPYFVDTLKLTLALISFVNNHSVVWSLLKESNGSALFRPADTRMLRLVLAAQRVYDDKNNLFTIFSSAAMRDFINQRGEEINRDRGETLGQSPVCVKEKGP